MAVPHRILHHHEHCMGVYQWTLPSSRLRYLIKAVSLQIYKKYNWQCTSAELAVFTAHIEGHWAEPTVLLHALHHYMLNNIGRF